MYIITLYVITLYIYIYIYIYILYSEDVRVKQHQYYIV